MTTREKLWLAFPDGYLPVRGVFTVGGWLCGGGATRRWWLMPDFDIFVREVHDIREDRDAYNEFRRLRNVGDLLPAVDPCDAATWGCLLRELAMRSSEFPEELLHAHDFHVIRVATDYSGNGPWRLCWRSSDSHGVVMDGLVGHSPNVADVVVQNLILRKKP